MRVVVTGADGFLGKHLVTALERNSMDVVSLPGPAASTGLNLDVATVRDMERILSPHRPDAVVHLAAQSSVSYSWINPADTMQTNVVGTTKLFLASAAAGARRFIAMSSAEVYQPRVGFLDEESAVGPLNPYGLSKMTMEQLLWQMVGKTSVDLCVARAFNLVGPGQRLGFVLSDWAAQLHTVRIGRGMPLTVGNLDPVRDFLDVRDAAQAITRLLKPQTPSGIYNVCSGEGRSLRQVLQDLLAVAGGVNPMITVDPSKFRPVDIPYLVGNSEKLKTLGWVPGIQWRDTLTDILNDVATRVFSGTGGWRAT